MSALIASNKMTAIVGLGITGLSVARFLARKQCFFQVFDTREAPPELDNFNREFAGVPLNLGALDDAALLNFAQIVLSPGVARTLPAIKQAIDAGVEVIGDIELFVREAKAPVVAITGSNGKTTVTSLVGELARAAGKKVYVGGNLGTPALELLNDEAELYVLELSSFQLESTRKLSAEVATILNVTADHMDRYDSVQQYWSAKQRIYWGAKKIVSNRDDALTRSPEARDKQYLTFGSGQPDLNQYGLIDDGKATFIARGFEYLVDVRDLKLAGRHNALNVQAALAIGELLGFTRASMIDTIKRFDGLAHRCQFVARIDEVDFYNDSKGTNLGATVAAVKGLARGKNVILIAGGDGKGADFSGFAQLAATYLKVLVGIGVDGPTIMQFAADHTQVFRADSLQQAVTIANTHKSPGDVVLLSPACASFDMFKNYEDRGRQFISCVEALCA